VPGVAQIPVTHRGITHEFTVVSGHLPPGHPDSLVVWPAIAQLRGTVVLMMAVENAPQIATALVDGGRPADTPVAVVVEGTMPEERTVLATLGTLADELMAHRVRPPAIIVVGEVVAVAHPTHYGREAAHR
jgi:uroporphyrin-III C-methyltransferase / precorrin-2 dehydrogenase / sirohydrochlorin ferrochelatase